MIVEGYFLAPKVKYLKLKNLKTGEEKEDFSFKGITKEWWKTQNKKQVFHNLFLR